MELSHGKLSPVAVIAAARRSARPFSRYLADAINNSSRAGQKVMLPRMGDPTLSPDEIRAAAQVHDELGPEYRDAVVESFLAKIDNQVAARIDAQLDSARPALDRARDLALMEKRRVQLGAAAVGSAITAMASVTAYAWWEHYPGASLGKALLFAWTVLAVAYIVYAWRLRRR